MTIAALRKEYQLASLSEADVDPDPYKQFNKWLAEAIAAALPEPTAMSLATVGAAALGAARPSSRVVLLKEVDSLGFVFYTNYHSRKGVEIAANPFAGLLFYWAELERQVRIEGRIEQISAAQSDSYFNTRPLASRLGAHASPQSKVIPSRAWLEQQEHAAKQKYGDSPPRPAHWGGYRVVADNLEFWQGRSSRLHDRIHYRLDANKVWRIERLAP